MRRLPNAPVSYRLRLALLALAVVGAPALIHAQQRDSTAALKPGTVLHTVKPGDTLFDIARRYLNNPFRWPELFRANSSQIANANLIFPGQKLYVGADGRPTFNPEGVAAVPEAEAAPTRAMPLGRSISAQTNSVLENATINGRALRPTVRHGEALAAPFLVPYRYTPVSGTLVARADPTVISAASSRDQFQIFDEVDVLLPPGTRGELGQQFGVYQPGAEVRRGAQRSRVMQPSGVVELVAIGTGRAARARVRTMYANMKRGDLLMPLDTTPVPTTVRPAEVANGPVYEVAYVAGGVVLPTVQNYIVIALPKGATSRIGDQFVLYAEGVPLTEGRTDVAPVNTVAQASVVHVTSEGATAIVTGHDQPAVRVGMRARLVSRMP
ncbi:MAG: LysM peptidoglycan-binding domain-containing protein [Gemmatimonadaceae bacterium]|nr:LysM peptidoglycan-binding domain-containing protein [Gemmatimonadaceae bacterium]